MILNFYSIFDNAVGAFASPFVCQNDAVALRDCEASMKGSMLGLFPAHFTLYHVGHFDSESGQVVESAARVVMNFGALEERKRQESTVSKVVGVSPSLSFEE